MAVRRIAEEQPENFVFTKQNLAWAKDQIAKYPEGKHASAVIPLLWRAQDQHNGWLPEPAIRYVADMLDMPFIRVMEVATFYTMYQLKPVGSVAHIQVCGTTPCMLRGSEELMAVCKSRISPNQHEVTEDGKYSWEEVECLGACVNAPMVQIFKDTFEDLTPETFEKMLNDMDAGRAIKPGPQTERHLSVNAEGRTQLFEGNLDYGPKADPHIAPYVMNGATALIDSDARAFGAANDDGSSSAQKAKKTASAVSQTLSPRKSKSDTPKSPQKTKAQPESDIPDSAAKLAVLPKNASAEDKANAVGTKPQGLVVPRNEGADDLKRIKGVGKVIEGKLNAQGIWHFDQIAVWNKPEIEWFDAFLSFHGRIERDGWIAQAKTLAEGGDTEFSKRVAKGEVATSSGGASKKPDGKAK